MHIQMEYLGIDWVKPSGWLLDQLQIQGQGLSRKLFDVWDSTGRYSAWLGGTGEDWERGPYYIDGLLPLAYYTNDEELMDIAMQFIRWTLSSQDGDGNFGPETTKKDWWSRVVMLKTLVQYYEITGDESALDFMEKYYRYMDSALAENPITQWGAARTADLLYCLIRQNKWRKLDCFESLAKQITAQSFDWAELFLDFPFVRPTAFYYDWKEMEKEIPVRIPRLMQYHLTHVVNVAMGLKYPAIQYALTGDSRYIEALDAGIEQLQKYHGVVTGMFNGDEHLSGANPTQGTELCAVVEYMFSLEVILEVLGETRYADILEKIAYNALPATVTEDWMGHQYLQQVNQISATNAKRNWFNNNDDANTYGLEPNFGCCAANMHQGWPKLLRGLWFQKGGDTLCAMSYAPCVLKGELDGRCVEIHEITDYPFKETICFVIEKTQGEYTLQFRIPEWCRNPRVKVNGEDVQGLVQKRFLSLRRQWAKGDRIELVLPMETKVSRWYKNSAGVERGPLVYGLAMNEEWTAFKEAGGIRDYEVRSNSRWNYALADLKTAAVKELEVTATPFSRKAPPAELLVDAVPLPEWRESGNMAGPVPQSPVLAEGDIEKIRLIPYGCTKLRIAQFPTLF